MNQLKVLTLLIIFIFLQDNLYALSSTKAYRIQQQDTSKLIKKATKKLGFFEKLFKHNDSAKLARKFIHQNHKKLKDKKTPTFPTGTTDVDLEKSFLKTDKNFELGYEVFGWYPYWEKDYYKHINFSLLSTVAYFSYEVNPSTGKAISTHEWETTSLIDSIKAYPNKKILLTVSNFGERNNRRFLRNSKSIDTLISNLIKLLDKRKGDGVCIDFEGIQKKEKDDYTGFLLTLSSRLKKVNKDYKIYAAVPSVNLTYVLDFKSLNQAIDKFVIMGYDYYGKTSSIAGPVAPLLSGKSWEPFNLTESVKYYLKEGVPNSKLILALPTYGSLWVTDNQSLQSKAKKYIGSRTYSYIKSEIENNEAVYIEPISKSAYSTYRVKGKKTEYRQCWFENDSSFVYKTNLIKKNKLAGLGLWALGYDKGYDDIWNVIYNELSKEEKAAMDASTDGSSEGEGTQGGDSNTSQQGNASTTEDDSDSTGVLQKISNALGVDDPDSKINKTEKELASITDYKTILLYIMCFALFFGCIGFLSAMMFPNTRANFFNSTSLKIYYSAFMLLLTIVIFRMQQWIDNSIVTLIIGFILGGIAYYIANTFVERKKKELP
ncbi:glycosyl hydrolase family 18 protein [Flavivirga aquimarina]|uniref:chitinase n=1 Tax=Flavivirga aquimarina TaxID=2027862 RepID=A0ABT8W740_9FLAO|nr:glycosyl hydrolase family 18 protein [Flavivirga aquimarina]MDO5968954.1 glycosyl hydrolase family 18 protein [Flavivirga aquimarina]